MAFLQTLKTTNQPQHYLWSGVARVRYATIKSMNGMETLGLTRKGMRVLPESSDLGVYMWQRPNGNWLADEQGRILSCNGREHDLRIMASMAAAAREAGYPDGKAVWIAGSLQCTDEEYQEQVDDLKSGKSPNVRISRTRR